MGQQLDMKQFTGSIFQYLACAVAETIYAGASDEAATLHVEEHFNTVVRQINDAKVRIADLVHDDELVKDVAVKLITTINDEQNGMKEIREMYFQIMEEFEKGRCDFLSMSEESLKKYGFERWVEEEGLMLIPIWAYGLIPDGTELTSINGNKAVKGKDPVSMVPRFGRLAWGFYLQKREGET